MLCSIMVGDDVMLVKPALQHVKAMVKAATQGNRTKRKEKPIAPASNKRVRVGKNSSAEEDPELDEIGDDKDTLSSHIVAMQTSVASMKSTFEQIEAELSAMKTIIAEMSRKGAIELAILYLPFHPITSVLVAERDAYVAAEFPVPGPERDAMTN